MSVPRKPIKGSRTPSELVLNLDVLLSRHAEEGGNAVAVRVPVREPPGGHAARGVGGGGVVVVGHVGLDGQVASD